MRNTKSLPIDSERIKTTYDLSAIDETKEFNSEYANELNNISNIIRNEDHKQMYSDIYGNPILRPKKRKYKRNKNNFNSNNIDDNVPRIDTSPYLIPTHDDLMVNNNRPLYGSKNKIIVVSYKLPLECKLNNNEWEFEWTDIRDIIGNIKQLSNQNPFTEVHFVGWPGITPKTVNERDRLEDALDNINCHPVWLNEEQITSFHDIYCRQTLWPLFHYMLPTRHESILKQCLNYEKYFKIYADVNNMYAKKASHQYDDNDNSVIWFQDYHLLLAPQFLRKSLPNAQMGLFLHTTFPTSEVFRSLPSREEILRGMLSCDLLGFHTYDYARHFLTAVKRVLSLDFHLEYRAGSLAISYYGRDVCLRISHVSVLSKEIKERATSFAVASIKENKWKKKFKDKKVILGYGELDVVRGTILTIEAFERFLETYGEYKNNVIFVLVVSALPEDYQAEQRNIDNNSKLLNDPQNVERCKTLISSVETPLEKRIDAIKKKYNNDDLILLLKLNKAYKNEDEFNELLALYQCCDIACFLTFWDGFNTIPYQFVAANSIDDNNKFPAIMLSQFMGCNRSLQGVFRVNPWAVSAVASTIYDSLIMTREERKLQHIKRTTHVMRYTFIHWANGFVQDLKKVAKRTLKASQNKILPIGFGTNCKLVFLPNHLNNLYDSGKLIKKYFKISNCRILIFDFGGTLTDTDEVNNRDGLNAKTINLIDYNNIQNNINDISGYINIRQTKTNSPINGIQGNGAVSNEIIKYLNELSEMENTIVAVVSGQTKDILDKEFSNKCPNLCLCAEKGAFIKWPNESEWNFNDVIKNDLDTISEWKNAVEKIMTIYTERTAASYIQKKETALCWHFEKCDPQYGELQSRELERYLKRVLTSYKGSVIVQQYTHSKVIEVLPRKINKGDTTLKIIDYMMKKMTDKYGGKGIKYETQDTFILTMGNDKSDEIMFRACDLAAMKVLKTEYAFTCKVGIEPTEAKYYLTHQNKILWLFRLLKNAKYTKNNRDISISSQSYYSDSSSLSNTKSLPTIISQSNTNSIINDNNNNNNNTNYNNNNIISNELVTMISKDGKWPRYVLKKIHPQSTSNFSRKIELK